MADQSAVDLFGHVHYDVAKEFATWMRIYTLIKADKAGHELFKKLRKISAVL